MKEHTGRGERESGGELRDIFACFALHAIIQKKGYDETACPESYKMADQMLAERDRCAQEFSKI